MSKLPLLMIAEVRKAIEPLTRVIITHGIDILSREIDMLLTRHSLDRIRPSKDTDSPSLIGIGKTLTGRPASGLAGQLAHALVAVLGVSVTSPILGTTLIKTVGLSLDNLIFETG